MKLIDQNRWELIANFSFPLTETHDSLLGGLFLPCLLASSLDFKEAPLSKWKVAQQGKPGSTMDTHIQQDTKEESFPSPSRLDPTGIQRFPSDDRKEKDAIYGVWDVVPPMKLPDAFLTLKGWSWAALKTGFEVPELSLLLDAGLPYPGNPQFILVSHLHSDHSGNLPMLLTDIGEVRPLVMVPPGGTPYVKSYIASYASMTSHTNRDFSDDSKFPCTFLELDADKSPVELELKGKKRYALTTFKCDHTVPCIGVGFAEIRMRLKPEYKGLPGKDIGSLRKQGVEVMERYEASQFVYLGDTTHRVFESYPGLFDYKTIICECSFIEDDHIEQAEATKHMHWKFLKQVIQEHPGNVFVLMHFSRRYKPSEIKAFFMKQKADFLAAQKPWNVVVWA